MSRVKDLLGGLDESLSAEAEAVARRFRAAEPFTGGIPLDKPAGPEGASPAPSPAGRAVRAQFSFPGADLQLLEDLQTRAAKRGVMLTRSQLVRAGLHALDTMTPGAFGEAVAQIAPLAKKESSTALKVVEQDQLVHRCRRQCHAFERSRALSARPLFHRREASTTRAC